MRILIAEDQALLREGLVRLFTDAGHDVVEAAADAEHVVADVARTAPDLVVLDVRMPPTFTDEGMRAALAVKRAAPHVGVLVLSQHVEPGHAAELVGLAGFGYLLKDRVLAVADFLDAAGRVARGGSALDPEVVARLMGQRHDGDALTELTAREREVLAMMAEGLTNGGIAARLVVSERTVESHVRQVLLKLDVPSGADDHRRVLAVLAHARAQQPAP